MIYWNILPEAALPLFRSEPFGETKNFTSASSAAAEMVPASSSAQANGFIGYRFLSGCGCSICLYYSKLEQLRQPGRRKKSTNGYTIENKVYRKSGLPPLGRRGMILRFRLEYSGERLILLSGINSKHRRKYHTKPF